MRLRLLSAVFTLCFALPLYAELLTTTDALGITVVERISTDAAGVEVTQVLSTTSGAPTYSLTTVPVQFEHQTNQRRQAVVEDDPTTTAATSTIYTYTTTNADGATVVEVATFTPTYESSSYTPTGTGTILSYSDWISLIGTSAAADLTSAAYPGLHHLGMGAGIVAGLLGGAWLVMA